ncbi:MAG: hypothetical protein WC404_07520, partial [Candidatus Omnitrophota bacterium]
SGKFGLQEEDSVVAFVRSVSREVVQTDVGEAGGCKIQVIKEAFSRSTIGGFLGELSKPKLLASLNKQLIVTDGRIRVSLAGKEDDFYAAAGATLAEQLADYLVAALKERKEELMYMTLTFMEVDNNNPAIKEIAKSIVDKFAEFNITSPLLALPGVAHTGIEAVMSHPESIFNIAIMYTNAYGSGLGTTPIGKNITVDDATYVYGVANVVRMALAGTPSIIFEARSRDDLEFIKEVLMEALSIARNKEIDTFGALVGSASSTTPAAPDEVALEQTGVKISFGTSGWRGKIGKDFILANIRRAVEGVALYYEKYIKEGELLVGFDPRKDNPLFAKETASILAAHGIKVRIIAGEPTPTPVLAYLANSTEEIAGVINFTASHNPAEDDGLKFSPYHGGAADKTTTDAITELANNASTYKRLDYEQAKESGLITEISLDEAINKYVFGYIIPTLKEIGAWKDIVDYIKNNPEFELVLDPMQGTGVNYIKAIYTAIAEEAGREFFKLIHTDNNDPQFSQVNHAPNPTLAASTTEIVEMVRNNPHAFGLAVDGDADRFGVIDFGGNLIEASQIIAVLAYFLNSQVGLTGAVGKTVATSNLVNAVAAYLGLNVEEVAVGFKWFVGKVMDEKVPFLVAGEESAHVTVGPFIKSWDDGMAVGLAALWLVAHTGKTITEYEAEMEKAIGKHFTIKTTTIRGEDDSIKKGVKDLIELTEKELKAKTPKLQTSIVKQTQKLQNQEIVDLITLDGLKVVFASGDWILLRPSGTEPAIKLYVEVTDSSRYENLLKVGKILLGVEKEEVGAVVRAEVKEDFQETPVATEEKALKAQAALFKDEAERIDDLVKDFVVNNDDEKLLVEIKELRKNIKVVKSNMRSANDKKDFAKIALYNLLGTKLGLMVPGDSAVSKEIARHAKFIFNKLYKNDPSRPVPGQPMSTRNEVNTEISRVGLDNAQALAAGAAEIKLAVSYLRSINENP